MDALSSDLVSTTEGAYPALIMNVEYFKLMTSFALKQKCNRALGSKARQEPARMPAAGAGGVLPSEYCKSIMQRKKSDTTFAVSDQRIAKGCHLMKNDR
jgi:hypothetical protein